MGSSPKLIVENIRYQTQHDIAIVRLGGRAVGEGLIHVPTLERVLCWTPTPFKDAIRTTVDWHLPLLTASAL